jgi:hypothetical protein
MKPVPLFTTRPIQRSILIAFIIMCGGVANSAQQIATAPASNSQTEVHPVVTDLAISTDLVTDLHLRPLFTTTIRLPEAVTSVAVGAPTLFEVEHSDQEPRLVFVKPRTKQAATSNLVIALQSGQEISMRLLSEGSGSGVLPVDFVVNYRPQRSFLIGSTDSLIANSEVKREDKPRQVRAIDRVLSRQADIATPDWVGGAGKNTKSQDSKAGGMPIVAALGEVLANGDGMLVAYSVLNMTDHWIEVLPPQVQLNSSGETGEKKSDKKKHEILAEQVPVGDYRLNVRRLAPGQRADGAVEFSRPGFKQTKDTLLLQLATASAVDTPLLLPVPFVAPGP